LSLESHMILLSHVSSGFFFLSVSFPVELILKNQCHWKY
jgi:phage-related protein